MDALCSVFLAFQSFFCRPQSSGPCKPHIALGPAWTGLLGKSPNTFGIYLCHITILIGLGEALGKDPIESAFWINVTAGTVVLFFSSYFLTVVLKKLPLLRWLV